MLERTFLLKEPELTPSQDYAQLRLLGLQHVERLAKELWTDYNVHDPGVTLLEVLCYAITDLGYRTDYDIKDLLTELEGNQFVNNSNFHTALQIMPCAPVSFHDLRKLLVDIRGVRNAWISPNREVQYCLDTFNAKLKNECTAETDVELAPLNGLYDVLLELEDYVEERRIFRKGKLEEAAPFVADSANYTAAAAQGMIFRVRYPIRLKSVKVYADGPSIGNNDNCTLRLLREEEGSFNLFTSTTVTLSEAKVKTEVPVEWSLLPGLYRMDAQGSTVDLLNSDDAAYPYAILQVFELLSGYDGSGADGRYYFFYDWEISFAVSPLLQDQLRDALPVAGQTGLSDNTQLPGGGYINAPNNASNQRGLHFNALCPFTLHTITVYAETAGTVSVLLLQDDTILEQQDGLAVAGGGLPEELALDWEVPQGLGYTLSVKGDVEGGGPIRLYRNTSASSVYPIALGDAVEITASVNPSGDLTDTMYYFAYQWQLTYQPCPLPATDTTREDVYLAAEDRLHEVRNLCEDFIHIRHLKTEEIGLCMDIEVAPEADLEEVLAEIYFQAEQYVAPPVQFYTIEELREKGKRTEDIFEGPVLDHGFIDDEEFRSIERRCFLRASDLIQIIMDVPGVTAVKSLLMLSFIEIEPGSQSPGDQVVELDGRLYKYVEEPWILHLQDRNFFAPDFLPERSKVYFYKNELPYLANRARVLELLSEKRGQSVRGKIKGHQQDLPVPIGTYKDLADYYPVQNDLPETYGVGQNQIPDSQSDLRKAQAQQLKGYLLFFEQILANSFAQLSNVKHLFSWEKEATATYFTQKVAEILNIESLYTEDYETILDSSLASIVETDKVRSDRKNRFLDHLLGRYSEDLSTYSRLMKSLFRNSASTRLITDKQAMLQDYPAVSSRRGQSYDYRYPERYDNITGFQRRVYRLLGIYDEDCTVGRMRFSSPNISIELEIIEEETYYYFTLADPEDETIIVFESTRCQSREEVCILVDALLAFGAEPGHWHKVEGEDRWELRRVGCEEGYTDEERRLGTTTAEVSTLTDFEEKVLAQFQAMAHREGFHLIEHILLRKRTAEEETDYLPVQLHAPDEPCECVEVRDPYSFRATVLLPSWPLRFRKMRFRQYVERVLREEAPAHVYLRICWINHCEMQELENCYEPWLRQLADLDHRTYTGQTPLPALADLSPADNTQLSEYRETLSQLIEKLYQLTNVAPVAQIHGCDDVDGEEPQISLNNTNLGSL
jgi:hypothetical protein